MAVVVKNYIIRNGRKLYGAAKNRVLASEKPKRNRKPVTVRNKTKPGRKRNVFGLMEASSALQLLDQIRKKNVGSRSAIRINKKRVLVGNKAKGYITKNPQRLKNLEMGFYKGGAFHPIRSSIDYSPAAVGESFKRGRGAGKKPARSTRNKQKNSPVLVLVNQSKAKKNAKSAQRKHRRNQEEGLFEKFHGYDSTKDEKINRPNSAPARLEHLGDLDRLFYRVDLEHVSTSGNQKGKTKSFLDIENITGPKLFLASNKEGTRYFIVSKGDLRLFTPNKVFGPLTRLEYTAKKPHLNKGSMRDQGYWHQLGEEDGNRPILKTDGEGCLVISGGNYRTEPDGIAN
jgi:hypothetical protein